MPKLQYIDGEVSPARERAIEQANEIIAEYMAQGYRLTLRQLYYQHVARDLIANKQSEYKRLGDLVNRGRLLGLIDWNAIEDRGRNLERLATWAAPSAILDDSADQYREDLWRDQPAYVEVWIEKEALVGVIEPVCDELRVPFLACKGYVSQSEAWAAGRSRFRVPGADRDATPVVIHLGDHDPSGLDMTRDLQERLTLFARRPVLVRRIALNRDQIDEYDPPPNPAKVTDSRFAGYQAEHGDDSWELDALEPGVLVDLIRGEVAEWIDHERWAEAQEAETENAQALRDVAERFKRDGN